MNPKKSKPKTYVAAPRYDVITEVRKSDIEYILEIKKYNPYHGPDGRFTSASGGGGVAGVSNFKPASSVEDARNYAKTELGFSGRVDYSYSYIDQDKRTQEVGSLDIDTINHINKTITEIQARYPELKGIAKNLECTASNVYAQAYFDGRSGSCSLQIGARTYKDGTEAVYDAWKGDVETGYHPKGTDGGAVLWHEYGHVYAGKVNLDNGGVNDVRNAAAEAGWKNQAAKKLNVSPDAVAVNVSRYATMSDAETFAEAFAAQNTGNGTKWTKALIEVAGAYRGN